MEKVWQPHLVKIEKVIEQYYSKIHFHLPKGFVDFIVQVIPYLAVIGAIVWSILTLLSLWGLFSLSLWALFTLLSIAFWVAFVYLLGTAFSPLKNKDKEGWDNLFAISLLAPVYNLVSVLLNYFLLLSVYKNANKTLEIVWFSPVGPSLGWMLVSFVIFSAIGFAIGQYFLFEIRGQYSVKNSQKTQNPSTETLQNTTQENQGEVL